MQDLPKLHMNYSSGAVIWGSLHPTEENIFLLENFDIYNYTPVHFSLCTLFRFFMFCTCCTLISSVHFVSFVLLYAYNLFLFCLPFLYFFYILTFCTIVLLVPFGVFWEYQKVPQSTQEYPQASSTSLHLMRSCSSSKACEPDQK